MKLPKPRALSAILVEYAVKFLEKYQSPPNLHIYPGRDTQAKR